MFSLKKSHESPLSPQARSRKRRHSRARSRRLTLEYLEARVCLSAPSIVITQQPVSFVAGSASSPIVQASMENSSGQVVSNDGGTEQNTYTLSATATLVDAANVLYGDYYFLGEYTSADVNERPASIAEAEALAGNPTANFESTLFSGTTYSGHDYGSINSFLGDTDAQTLSTNLTSNVETSYIDLKGYVNVSAADAGVATFNLHSDDQAILTIDGLPVLTTDDNFTASTPVEVDLSA